MPLTSPRPYWYDDDRAVVAVLEALRRFRRADQEMRTRISAGMRMNVTDLQALRFVIAAERRGTATTPRALAEHLHISTASTTKLLDRLAASGHLVREPHPTDRRSLVVVATDHAHHEVRERLARMHEEMAQIAHDIPPAARPSVEQFLLAMADRLEQEGDVEPLRPDPHLDGPSPTA
ncbi:MarR family winged helix-turn-helix transcriptional regulator [Isoptericola sp. BMS4]|uniref:MarR family winged helix-turn-helix transcriptional regulator n=1 Tax=Isoptericola sp. BMS4 TaxID=2527875 RepID=UPI00141D85E5|nr:MarR family transcriptional regulator [Isoptericola sp. BMS4]